MPLIIIIITIIMIIIIKMENCKAPTLLLKVKVLNKHSITHIMYIEMENAIRKKRNTHNVDINKSSSITMQKVHARAHMHARIHTRMHTHTVQTDRGEGQCCLI